MKFIILALATLAMGALAAAPLFRKDDPDSIADNYIVVMRTGLDRQAVQTHFESVQTTSLNLSGGKRGFVRQFHIEEFHAYHVECDEAMLQDIRNHEFVDYVSHDSVVRPYESVPRHAGAAGLLTPQVYVSPWGLSRISHREPSLHGYVGTPVPQNSTPSIAYVIDSGIRITHQEFGNRTSWGANFVDDSPDEDELGHGTHVTGTIIGKSTGVSKTSLAIAVKIFNAEGYGLVSAFIAGLDWAVQHAQNASSISRSVVNASLGSGVDKTVNDAIQNAISAGMTVVVAAGNSNTDACTTSPASAPDAITVAASDSNDLRAWFSNYGTCVDIFAPGADVRSSFNGNDSDYANLSGTSMATPHVAGLAAYLMARENLTTPKAVRDRILQLATPDKVNDTGPGTPNLIAFNGNPAELSE
ncbi:subtilisin-like protease [Xylariaceae sp. FL1651]|nr:subtilisin-like protease [Xylariaceae sp. FL1651]